MNKKGQGRSYQRVPFVKEWGSWAVFIYSCATGLAAGLLTRPWQAGNGYSLRTFAAILGLVFLVNSKAPFGSFLRAQKDDKEHLGWLMLFVLTGLALLLPFLLEAAQILIVSVLLVALYMGFVSAGKEHYLLAELNGFALLALSAPIVYFVVTGDLSWRLYAAVLVYFSAGVLKVRARLKKTFFYRVLMLIYCAAAPLFYSYAGIPVILLLPLLENVLSVILMKEERLRTTGNIELIKGALFLLLVVFFWE